MKNRIIAVIITAILLFNLGACAQEVPEIPTMQTTDDTATFAGVVLSVDGIIRTGKDTVLHLTWNNATEYGVLYGDMFCLEQLVNGQWVALASKENTAFHTIGYMLQPGESVLKSYSTEWIYGSLERPGTYRFTTNCTVYNTPEGTDCNVSVEFTLRNLEEWGYVPNPMYRQPPVLTLKLGTETREYVASSCVWSYRESVYGGNSEEHTLIGDGIHPLLCKETLKRVETTVPETILEFEDMPDEITVRCWPDSMFGNPNAEAETWKGNRFNLKPAIDGGYVYEITCTWNDNGLPYFGTVTYYLYIACYPVMPIQPRN